MSRAEPIAKPRLIKRRPNRKRNAMAPSPRRVRAWQRKREWKQHQERRRTIRQRGTYAASLIAQQKARAADGRLLLFPTPLPQLLRDTRSTIAVMIAGWIAFAWELHGNVELIASYEQLALLCGCSEPTARKWVAQLREWGWIMATQHYETDKAGVDWQKSNSYAPGFEMRKALAEMAQHRRNGRRADPSFFASEVQGDPIGSAVALLPKKKERTSDAHAREGGAPAAEEIRRPTGASQVLDSPPTSTPPPTTEEVGRVGVLSEPIADGDGAQSVRGDATRALLDLAGRSDVVEAYPALPGESAALDASCEARPPPPARPGRTVVLRQLELRLRAVESAGGDVGRLALQFMKRMTEGR